MTRAGSRAFAAVLLCAALLRAWGTVFGLPFGYHPDEEHVLEPARRLFAEGTLDPGWYRYPSLLIWVQAPIQELSRRLVGTDGMTSGVSDWIWTGRWLGRLVVTCLGVAAVWLVGSGARRALGERVALFAAAMLALSPLHLRHSQFVTTDVPASLAAAAVLLWCLRAATSTDESAGKVRRNLCVAAALSGVAAATKYNAGLVVAAPLLTWVAWRPREAGRALLACGLASAAAFVAFFPFVFTDFAAVLADIGFEARHYAQGGHVGFDTGFGPAVLGRALVVDALGGIGALGAAVGTVVLVRARNRPLAAALLGFPILYFAFLSSMRVHIDRNLMPLLPYLCCVSGVGFDRLADALQRQGRVGGRARAGAAVAAAVVLPLAMVGALANLELVRTDTRTEAQAWMDANVSPDARICREYFTPELPHHRVFLAPSICARGAELLAASCDLVVTSSFMRDAFASDPDEQTANACYRALDGWHLLAEFDGTPMGVYHDPTIRVVSPRPVEAPPLPTNE